MSEETTSVQDTPTGQEEQVSKKPLADEGGSQDAENKSPVEALFSELSTEDAESGKEPSQATEKKGFENVADPDLEKLKPDMDVPEKPFDGKIGDYTLKLPVGVKPDDPQLTQFTDVLKKSEVKGDKAQGLVDLFIENRKKAGEELINLDKKFRDQINESWITQNRTDPEIGGDKLSATANYVQKALRTIFTKEELLQTTETDGKMGFLEFMQKANIKNAPPLVKLLSRIGKKLSESTPVSSSVSVSKRESKEKKDVLFGEI